MKAISTLLLLPFLLASLAFADELTVDAGSRVASSLEQWVLKGAKTGPGPNGGLSILIASGLNDTDSLDDLYIDFDSPKAIDWSGRWSLSGSFLSVGAEEARTGEGAARFRAPLDKLELRPESSLIFSDKYSAGDFSIEFWLKPDRADSGEIIFLWKSSLQSGKNWLSQQFTCLIQRNHLNFGFLNFFSHPDGISTSYNLESASVIVPGRWSHHLLRFDSTTGLLEYLMDGRVEAVSYISSTKREGGTVYPFRAGSGGSFQLAPNYSGFMDDFRVRAEWVDRADLGKFNPQGAEVTSPIFDLGSTNSQIDRIDAKFRVQDEAAIQWFYRSADSSAGWKKDQPEWLPFLPGKPLKDENGFTPYGRYIQLRIFMYPDASNEKSPVLDSISILFEKDEPPAPPSGLTAIAGDGSISLYWKPSNEADVAGYMIYYGTNPGVYFGNDAREGNSPIMVLGARSSSYKLNGLENGKLYFIAIAAFDRADPPHIGEFSREINARPSRM